MTDEFTSRLFTESILVTKIISIVIVIDIGSIYFFHLRARNYLISYFKSMDVIIFLQTTIIATNFPIMENKNKKTLQFSWPYKRKNYVLFGVGVFVIIVGYLIMYSGEVDSFQSLVISPLLLLAGYLVIIPMALLSKK